MTTNIELQRDHTGKLHLFVAGVPALFAEVTGITNISDKLTAVIVVPLDNLTMGEISTVVPLKRAA